MAEVTRATGTVLDRIVADRRVRLEEDFRAVTEPELAERAGRLPGATLDFASRLRDGSATTPDGARVRLIAEIKRASPSKGVFDADLDATRQARAYADAGAAAVSVLTEPDHFRGGFEDLEDARREFGEEPGRPALLCKDFIFDARQVALAQAHGADALLLIVAVLEPAALADLVALTRARGMEPLVEAHDEGEMEAAMRAGASVLGVNNRDLRTFKVDLGTTERLAHAVPADAVLVAESGITTAADARRMAEAGAAALLVGEALVTADDTRAKARELMLIDATIAGRATEDGA